MDSPIRGFTMCWRLAPLYAVAVVLSSASEEARVLSKPADVSNEDFIPHLGHISSPLDDLIHSAGALHGLMPLDLPGLSMQQHPRLLLRTHVMLPTAFHTILSQMSSASIGHSGGFHMRVTNQSVVINGEVPAYNHPNEDGYGSKVSVKRYAHGLVIRASTQHDGVSRLMQRFYTLGGDCNLNKTRVEFDKTSGKLTITVPREGAKVDDRVVSSRHQKAIETAAAHAHEKNRIRVVFDDHGGSAHVFVPKTSGGILTLLGDKLTLEDGEVVHLPVVMDEAAKERYDSNDMLHYVLKTKDEPQELLPFSEEL